MKTWKTLSRRAIFETPKFLTVELHSVELHDGRVIHDWPWLVTPDYANVLAETTEGRFLCFRQTKYAVEGISLAPVGGFIEPGEPPLEAAKRELLEETGHAAGEWQSLGVYTVDANRGAGKAHLFLARGAHCVAPIHKDDLEEQQLLELTRDDLKRAHANGEFKVLAWALVISLGLQRLGD